MDLYSTNQPHRRVEMIIFWILLTILLCISLGVYWAGKNVEDKSNTLHKQKVANELESKVNNWIAEDKVKQLVEVIVTNQLKAPLEQRVIEKLERLGCEVKVHSEKGHMAGQIYHCTGSDSSSNCHAMCVNGSMCDKRGGYWVVDTPRKIEVKLSD